jgi:dolichyl-phosphate beta-glucosyltransferase
MTESARENVSIVVPAYAEEGRIGAAVAALRKFADGFPRLTEVLLVIEPSGDRTAEVAREAAAGSPVFEVIENPVHRGKGHSVRTGMLRASGGIIFFMDADLSVPLAFIPPFVAHLDARPAVAAAIASRRHPGSVITRRQHPLREQSGRCFNRVVRILGISPGKDTQCGFKAFRRAAARDIFSRARIDGFAFDAEVLMLARLRGHPVDELPVEWINADHSKFRALPDGWRSFLDLIRIRFGTRAP